jgi:hypothetical protein
VIFVKTKKLARDAKTATTSPQPHPSAATQPANLIASSVPHRTPVTSAGKATTSQRTIHADHAHLIANSATRLIA